MLLSVSGKFFLHFVSFSLLISRVEFHIVRVRGNLLSLFDVRFHKGFLIVSMLLQFLSACGIRDFVFFSAIYWCGSFGERPSLDDATQEVMSSCR